MQKKLGVALGSGADRGFAHIGVLKVLESENIPIQAITGTSIGAVIAAAYALNMDLEALEQLAMEFSTRYLVQLIDLNLPIISLFKGEKIKRWLKDNLYGEATLEQTKIPCAVVATALENGQRYVFKTGSIVEAVMASGTVPGIWPPTEREGKHLVDGGLAEAVPLTTLAEFGVEVKVGVDLYSYNPMPPTAFTAKEVMERVYRLYLAKLSAIEREQAVTGTVMVCPQTNEGLETLTFSHARQNLDAGEHAIRQELAKIKQLLAA